MDWGRGGLLISKREKLKWFHFDRSNNTGAIDVKMDGPLLEEKLSFKMLGLLSLLNWIGVLTLSLFLKLCPGKFEP